MNFVYKTENRYQVHCKAILSGACGRMGTKILAAAAQTDDIRIAGAIGRSGSECIGKELAGGIVVQDTLVPGIAGDEILIEFSTPQATMEHLKVAVASNIPILIGTTGLSSAQDTLIRQAAQNIPVLVSHNYGIGMNAFWEILKVATRYLGHDYDIEVIEFHANNKPDVPSGTGGTIARIIAEERGDALEDVIRYGRDKTTANSRKPKEIGMHSLRAGSYRSDHTVIFAGNGERLEFTHREEDSSIIARGVLWGLRFLHGRAPGLYSMGDVLKYMQSVQNVPGTN